MTPAYPQQRDCDWEPEPTHYLPAFVQTRIFRGRESKRKQIAVCGAAIEPHEHSTAPSCPTCLRWLEQDAEDAEGIYASLGYVQDSHGNWTPNDGRRID